MPIMQVVYKFNWFLWNVCQLTVISVYPVPWLLIYCLVMID